MRWHFPAEGVLAGDAGDQRHVLYSYCKCLTSVLVDIRTQIRDPGSGFDDSVQTCRVSCALDMSGCTILSCPSVLAMQSGTSHVQTAVLDSWGPAPLRVCSGDRMASVRNSPMISDTRSPLELAWVTVAGYSPTRLQVAAESELPDMALGHLVPRRATQPAASGI